jgi:hypothetical protein
MNRSEIIVTTARMTREQYRWLREQADANLSSQNSELVRALRERMDRVEREKAA